MKISGNGEHIPILKKIGFERFKAIHKSGQIVLQPFTVFIGMNGSGKSSILEALESYRSIVLNGLNSAFIRVGEFEKVWHRDQRSHEAMRNGGDNGAVRGAADPMRFDLTIKMPVASVRTGLAVEPSEDQERLEITEKFIRQVKTGNGQRSQRMNGETMRSANEGELYRDLIDYVQSWQFMFMNPELMKLPIPKEREKKRIVLMPDASNLAEYLRDIRKRDSEAYEDIIETIRCILPSVQGISASFARELRSEVYLTFLEGGRQIAGNVISAGILRILALLSLLRDPEGPQLIVIDEIENGLDPRTVNLLLDEIKAATDNRVVQIIATSHSPYLLDQLPLKNVVVVERKRSSGRSGRLPAATFWRPSTSQSCQNWAESFNTGEMYTMCQLYKH